MRRFRQFTVFLTVCLLIMALAACEPNSDTEPTTESTTEATAEPTLTKEWVVMNMDNAMSQHPPTSYKMTFSASMKHQGEETVEEYGYALESKIITAHDPLQSFNNTTMTITSPDQVTTITVQEYCIEEDGIVISYFKDASSHFWTRTDSGMRVSDYLAAGYASISISEIWPGYFAFDSWTIEPDKAMINGVEAYVLHTTLPMSTFESVLSAFGLHENEDLTAQRIPITYYADRESFSVIQVTVDLSSVSQKICGILAENLPETSDDHLSHHTVGLVYELGYGAQSVPPLPPSVLETEDLKVLEWGSSYLLVTAPEGWTTNRTDSHSATVACKQASVQITYSDMTEDDFQAAVSAEAEHMDDLGLYRSRNTLESVNGYAVTQIRTRGTTYYHAWKELGDGAVYLHISDYDYDGDVQTLLELLTGCVSLYAD